MSQSCFGHGFDMTLFFVFLLLLPAVQIKGNARETLSCQDLSDEQEFQVGQYAVLKIIVPPNPVRFIAYGPTKPFRISEDADQCRLYSQQTNTSATAAPSGGIQNCDYLDCDNHSIIAAVISKFSSFEAGIWDFTIIYENNSIDRQIKAYETEYDGRFCNKTIEVKNGEYMVMNFRGRDNKDKDCFLINERTNERYNLSDAAFKYPENGANIWTADHCGFRMLVTNETQGNWSFVEESGWNRYKTHFGVHINSSIVRESLSPNVQTFVLRMNKTSWFEGFEGIFPADRDFFRGDFLELEDRGKDIIRLSDTSQKQINVGLVSSDDRGIWRMRFAESNSVYLRATNLSIKVQAFPPFSPQFYNDSRDHSHSLRISTTNAVTMYNGCTIKYGDKSLVDCERDHTWDGAYILIPSGTIYDKNDIKDLKLSMEYLNFHLEILILHKKKKTRNGKSFDHWIQYVWHSRQMQKYVNRGGTLKIKCSIKNNADDALNECSIMSPQGTMYIQRDSSFLTEIDKEFGGKIYSCNTTIVNVNDAHSGTWTCNMDFKNGTKVHSLIPVRVTESDLIPGVKEANGTVYFQCQLSPTKRFRKIVLCKWFHGNDSIKQDSTNYKFSMKDKNCSLEVKNPSEKDVGSWKCSVRLDLGGYRNATIELPKISVKGKEPDEKFQIGNGTFNIEKLYNFQVDVPVEKSNRTTNNIKNNSSIDDTTSGGQSFFNISHIQTYLIIILSLFLIVFFAVLVYLCTVGKKHWRREVIEEETPTTFVNIVSPGPQNITEQIIEEETAPRFLNRVSTGPLNIRDLLRQDDHILPYDENKWEYPLKKLVLVKEIGGGNFGEVWKGWAPNIQKDGKNTKVAAKGIVSCTNSNKRAFAMELRIFSNLGNHPNIVNLLGACTRDVPNENSWIILEYCQFGSLKAYMKNHKSEFTDEINIMVCGGRDMEEICLGRTDNNIIGEAADVLESANNMVRDSDYGMDADGNLRMPRLPSNSSGDSNRYLEEVSDEDETGPFSTGDLLTWASQVAHGMDFLREKNVLHGDLAARNVLLTDNRTAKICDFGLSRSLPKLKDYYRNMINNELPLLNSAIEVIEERKFSTKSDVWSFGILVWELLSLGAKPYDIAIQDPVNTSILLDFLKIGRRLEKPPYATERLYKMMLHCWEKEPNDRPSFSDLIDELENILNGELTQHE